MAILPGHHVTRTAPPMGLPHWQVACLVVAASLASFALATLSSLAGAQSSGSLSSCACSGNAEPLAAESGAPAPAIAAGAAAGAAGATAEVGLGAAEAGTGAAGAGALGGAAWPKPIPPMRERPMIGDLLREEGKERGVEVGVQEGVYAATILQRWTTCKEYILVDLWKHQENYADGANVDDSRQEQLYRDTQSRLSQWIGVTKFHRMYSSQAAPLIANESLDWAYIDARHDYCGCMEDLNLFWPKLKSGGIMSGHDYLYATELTDGQDWSLCQDGSKQPGAVRGAVEEFFHAQGLQISVTYADGNGNSWLVRKP